MAVPLVLPPRVITASGFIADMLIGIDKSERDPEPLTPVL